MRQNLLEGKLEYPGEKVFELYPDSEKDILRFWRALWLNHLNDQDTNGIHWYNELGCVVYNYVVRSLDQAGWITTHAITARKWASVELSNDKLYEFITPDELMEIKKKYKYTKYTIQCAKSRASELVRQNGKTRRTGLVRKGFRDAGNTQFGYDMETLARYEASVKKNLTKSMDKIRAYYPEMRTDEASYDAVSVGVYDWHKQNAYLTFTTGDSISDSRGRAISSALTKIANPISSKDFRSALVITYEQEIP